MATKVRLSSGLISIRLSEQEQAIAWKELDVDVQPVGLKHPYYTPQDELEYFIIKEKKISHDKFQATIKANGNTFHLKYNVCNQQEKTYQAVRKQWKLK